VLLVFLGAGVASAKRAAPPDVAAVVHEGRRYEAPHFDNPCGQSGGCVVAREDFTGKPLWALKVYCTSYDTSRERDLQDVFITGLSLQDGKLAVTNEKGHTFLIDLTTHEVTGDDRGCSSAGGCSYSPRARTAPVFLAALAGLVVFWRRRSARR
jgi:hypothetical protein